MISQSQISGTRRALSTLQRRRKLAIWAVSLPVLGLLPLAASPYSPGSFDHEVIETAGLVMIALAILGRAWCTLYIGGRKASTLTRSGPYSISRNPLYVFSFIGAAGIGAQSGSLLMAAVFAIAAFAIFLPVILREERALHDIFGGEFDRYIAEVPRFAPRFSAWRDMETMEIRPRLVWRTLRDGLAFALAIPVFELVDWLHSSGLVQPLFHLP